MAEVRFVRQGHVILEMSDEMVRSIANAARTCYRSEALSGPESDARLVRKLVSLGHEAMLEHAWVSVRFVTSRAIANELVRHRLFSFAQESTRYVNSTRRGFEFVMPDGIEQFERMAIEDVCERAADEYEYMVGVGTRPEVARAVLPLCTATTIVASGNVREWRHALRLRTEVHAHPEMRALMTPLLRELQGRVPILFDDISAHDDGPGDATRAHDGNDDKGGRE